MNSPFDEIADGGHPTCLAYARTVIAGWRRDYNQRRPHGASGHASPATFAARCPTLAPESGKSSTIETADSGSDRH